MMNHRPKYIVAFTLTELLVVIAVFVILLAILLPSLFNIRQKASLTDGVQSMRNISMALTLYLNENQNKLPRLDATSQFVAREAFSNQLVTHLLKFLDAEDVNIWEYVPGTASAAFLNIVDTPEWGLRRVPAYWCNPWVSNDSGSLVRPFGYRGGTAPMFIQHVHQPGRQVALIDYDNELPSNTGNPIRLGGPILKPLHGNFRVALYFDWSVRAVPIEENFYLQKDW